MARHDDALARTPLLADENGADDTDAPATGQSYADAVSDGKSLNHGDRATTVVTCDEVRRPPCAARAARAPPWLTVDRGDASRRGTARDTQALEYVGFGRFQLRMLVMCGLCWMAVRVAPPRRRPGGRRLTRVEPAADATQTDARRRRTLPR